MQAKCSLCLIKEKELAPFIKELKEKHPDVEVALFERVGSIEILFKSESPLDSLIELVKKKFSGFFYGEGRIEEALQCEMIARKKTLALAESCTGGSVAARLTSVPDCSKYLLGSIVAYSNGWKERFLHVSRSTLKDYGAVSKQTVIEMVQGLFEETDADYAAAISGIAGPSGGERGKPVGTIYIAIGKRHESIDAGLIQGPKDRLGVIEYAVQFTLGGLWRRVVHNAVTFS